MYRGRRPKKLAIKHVPTLPRSKTQTHRQSRKEWLSAQERGVIEDQELLNGTVQSRCKPTTPIPEATRKTAWRFAHTPVVRSSGTPHNGLSSIRAAHKHPSNVVVYVSISFYCSGVSAHVSEFPCLQVGVVAISSPYVCVVLCVGTCLCVHAATSLVKYFLTNTAVQVSLQTPETTIIY